jgi:hypothetical protein
MSVLTKSVPIVTAADGSASVDVRAGGLILHAIRVELGTLDTPDITVKEQPANTTIIAVAGVAADATYYPSVLSDDASGADVAGAAVPVPVYDRLEVTVAGGGNAKTGRLILLYER